MDIGRQTDTGLFDYFLTEYGDETSPAFQVSLLLFSLQLPLREQGVAQALQHGLLIAN